MKTFPKNDPHGKRSIPGMAEVMTTRKEKEIKAGLALAPKSPNGLNDPFSYYHVVDILLNLKPGDLTKVSEISDLLAARPIRWDNVTVGRIINDVAESLRITNGREPIQSRRYWDGTRYWTSSDIEDRVAMENLLSDLYVLCVNGGQSDGASPVYRCPSVS